ncbi:MAG TPA: LysE family transporter [Acidimicrobiales bacterium]|jgi:threonine/homoserine/homoserine lactone efflux protein
MLPALLTGLGLGALVAAQVGPVSLLCIRTTLRYGFAPGLAVGAGAATVDTVYGALGMVGAASLIGITSVRITLGALGAAVLVVMGARTLRTAQRVRIGLEVPSEVVTPGRALRTALAATASNPLTIASWATAFAAASTASVVGSWSDGLALLAGIGTGSIGWFAVLSAGVALAGRRLGDRAVQAADVVAGAGLVGFGALLGFRTLHDR